MPTGRIKFYDSTKGFGFAQTDEGEEVHVPASALPAGVTELRGGTRVEFGVAEGRRGKQALSLRVLDAAPAEERTAVPPARRRAPRRDELLAAAVDTARAGLAGLAAPDEVGEHVDVLVDDDRLLTHRFACRMPGYAGWLWYVTIARAPRAKQVTVCETGLMAGEGALVAPPWVPYAERVNEEERERLKAVAEGRVPGAPAPETAPDDRG